jgi:glycosyltransferase involved in cell wall biosynthesis
MGSSSIGKVGVVSHILPPSPSGQAVVLYRLLSGFPPHRYCLISREECREVRNGDGSFRLGGRVHHLAPVHQLPVVGSFRLPVLSVPVNAAMGIGQRARQIARIVREEGCRMLIGCTGDLYDLPAACLASRWAKVPFVPYLFDDYTYQWTGVSRSVSKRLEPMILRRSRGAIVPNEYMREEYARRHGIQCAVVRNPCPLPDLDILDRSPRIFHEGSVDIVYTGAVYHANCDAIRNLLAAIGTLGRTDVRLHLYTAQTREEIGRMGIAGPAVVHHPHIPPHEVPAVLRQASLLFLPLGFDTPIPEVIRTSAPGKTGEYLSVGKPILVHAPGDSFVSWYFRENRCGVVADRSDPDLLSSSLERLLSDPELREDLGSRARFAAERDFDVVAVRGRFEEALGAFGGEEGHDV